MDTMAVVMRNLDSVKNRTDYHYLINHDDGIKDSIMVFPSIINQKDVPSLTSLGRGLPLDYFGNWSTETDSATFEIVTALEPEPKDVNPNNDTVRYLQKFYNYYAYDDGTAEASYFLNTAGARLAYQFTSIMPGSDTLRGVDMYFAQNIVDQSEESFFLTVWSSLAPETIVYQQKSELPVFEDSLNEFHTYLLDDIVTVSGTYYVGWVQPTSTRLNIGYDFNSNHSSKTFYNVAGTWLQTVLKGTIMMRPLFGDTVILPLTIAEQEDVTRIVNRYTVFPNPANGFIQIQLDNQNEQSNNFHVIILDLFGREVISEQNSSGKVDIQELADGIYFVKVRSQGTEEFETKKIFVSH